MLCLEICCVKGLTSSLGYTFTIGLFHPVSVESVKKKGGLHFFLKVCLQSPISFLKTVIRFSLFTQALNYYLFPL